MTRVFLVLLFFVFSMSAEAIVGGELVDLEDLEAKSTVGLSNGCTGVLISEEHVLTAAHCISGAAVEVVFGLDFSDALRLPVAGIRRHEDYGRRTRGGSSPDRPTLDPVHDIALLKLAVKAPEGFVPVDTFKPLEIRRGDELILSGFGQTNPRTGAGFGTLRKVRTVFNFYNERALEVVFGPTPGRSACRGDSGGPMYVEQGDGSLLLIGLTSRGFASLGPCSGNGNYTSVDAHREWIGRGIDEL